MISYLKFRFSAFDTLNFPFTGSAKLFCGEGPTGRNVTATVEAEAVRWLLRTPPARTVLLEELKLPMETYAQAEVVEPVVFDRLKKPGDINLLLAGEGGAKQSISIQAKRVKIEAVDNDHDHMSHRHLKGLKDLIVQANGSRDLGFHLNYAMVLIQVDGIAKSDLNFLSRGITNGHLTRVYHLMMDSPLHQDVGVIFVEISQPTRVSIDRAGVVAVCVDKRAIPLDQPRRLTAGIRQLMANCPTL